MTNTQASWVVALLFMLVLMLCWACTLLEKIHKTLEEKD
jgi:hypothetical protein